MYVSGEYALARSAAISFSVGMNELSVTSENTSSSRLKQELNEKVSIIKIKNCFRNLFMIIFYLK